MSKQPNFKQAALDYAGKGWHVFPIKPEDKKPAIFEWQKLATTDPAQIEAWWSKWPKANIGLACGLSELTVIDIDVKTHDGFGSWAELDQGGPITTTSLTPSGGKHLIYDSNGTTYKNSAGKIASGIDVRGGGGYVVLPPSTIDGIPYRWEVGLEHLAPVPEWLAGRLAAKDEHPDEKPLEVYNPESYLAAALKGELQRAAVLDPTGIPRNETLNQIAYRLGRLAHLGGVDGEEILVQLRDQAIKWHQVPKAGDAPDELAHAFETIERAFAEGQANPREVVPKKSKSRLNLAKTPAEEQQEKPETQEWEPSTWADAMKPLPPVEWLVDEMVRLPSLNVLFGQEGTLKTMLAYDLALALASGAGWLNPKTGDARFTVNKPRRILMLDQDMTRTLMHERIQALTKGYGYKPNGNLFWDSYPEPEVNLRDNEYINLLATKIRQYDVDLVILDNLISVAGAEDENSNNEMYQATKNVRKIMHALDDKVSFLILAHPPKGGDTIRGASAVPGAIDNSWMVTRDGQADEVTITHKKMRMNPVETFAARFHYVQKSDRTLKTAKFEFIAKTTAKAAQDAILDTVLLDAVKSQPGIETPDLIPLVAEVLGGDDDTARNKIKDACSRGVIHRKKLKKRGSPFGHWPIRKVTVGDSDETQ